MNKDYFIYGTQFYRPPNPPKEQRMQDLENVKKLGFNIIKIFAEWNWINHREGVYDFDEMIEIIEKAEKLGITVLVNTRLEQAPYWLAEKYPDAYYVSADGKKVELHTRSNTPTGGWPGLCFDHPGVRSEAEKFLVQCAVSLGKYENVKVFDCWNEPHIEPADPTDSVKLGDWLYCYCPNTIEKYRNWLKQKYKTIDNINSHWHRKYRGFNDINPPKKRMDYVDMMEWRKFMTYSMAEKMSWRYRTLKENLPEDTLVMSHTVSHGITTGFSIYGCDDYQLSKDLDLFGLSLFPKWANASALDVCCDVEVTRSMSRGKICLNSELQGGPSHSAPSGFSRSKIPQRNDYRLWNFIDVAFGMKGILYWHYRAEMLGLEAPGFGLVNRDGSPTDRSDETSKLCRFLNKYQDIFNNFKMPENCTAIVVNRDSYYLNFAAEGNELYSASSVKGMYRFLLKHNIGSDFLIDTQLKDKIFNYKLVYLSFPLVMNEGMADLLKEYVQRGGILISDCCVGMFNEFGVSSEKVPSCGLDEVFGARQDNFRQFDWENREEVHTRFFLDYSEVKKNPNIYAQGVNDLKFHKVKITTFLESYILEGAKPILENEGKATGTLKTYGKGKAYLLGTVVGQSLFMNDPDTEKALTKILDNERIEYLYKSNLIIRKLEYKDRGGLVLINPNKEKIRQEISLDQKVKIIETYDKDFSYRLSSNNLSFEINPENAQCIIYEKT